MRDFLLHHYTFMRNFSPFHYIFMRDFSHKDAVKATDKSSRRKTKQFSSYFRFPTSHTTVRAVPHTAVPILGVIQDTTPLK